MKNLIEQGIRRLEEASLIPNQKVTLLNRRAIERAKREERLTTDIEIGQDGKRKGERISGIVVEGKGKARHKSKSWAAKVIPIFQGIVRQRGKRMLPENDESLKDSRQRVERGHPVLGTSLAGRALMARHIIQQTEDQNTLAENRHQRHQKAQEILLQMQIAEAKRMGLELPPPETQNLLRQIGGGLTREAAATLVGEPRAGTENLELDINRGVFAVEAPTRCLGTTDVPIRRVIDGIYQVECRLDPLSRLVNLGRAVIGKPPVALFGVGVIKLRHTLTDEIVAGKVTRKPLEKAAEINQVVSAMRTLDEPLLLERPKPTYADLGLSGPELVGQSDEMRSSNSKIALDK